jgi:hypothetical protein
LTPERCARWVAEARWQAAPGVDPARLANLLDRARARLASGCPAGWSTRRKVWFPLALSGAEPDHLLQVRVYDGLGWVRRGSEGAARAELRRALAVAALGIATPIPVAAGELRRHGLLEASLLLVPMVVEARDLAGVWRAGAVAPAARRTWIRELGWLVRRMHDAGIDQEDLAPNNFLWRPSAEPHLLAVDFERVRVARRPVGERRRIRALAKLDRHVPNASASERLRFASAYTAGDRAASRRLWRAVTEEHAALARDDLRHFRRVATRESRRFVPVDQAGWQGWSRRGASLAGLLDELRDDALRCNFTRPSPSHWLRGLGPLRTHEAERAWCAAQTLAQRGVAPVAEALLRRSDLAVLVLTPPEGARLLGSSPDPARDRAALTVLLDRLLVLGFDLARIEADALALGADTRGALRAWLLDPSGLLPARIIARGDRATARAHALRLVGESERRQT